MDPTSRPDELTMDFAPTQGYQGSNAKTEATGNGTAISAETVISPPGFNLLRELGRGGMGVVFLARQKNLGREVALKMILAGVYSSEQEKLRFLAEAEAVAAVSHQNIVQIFDLGTHQDLPFFALEYCPGGSLAQKLGGNPIPPREAAELVRVLSQAVQAAHRKGIIHRDLKPANILLAADGSPKITDFGLARRTESASGLTQSGAIVGTPSYMAPEQAGTKGKAITPATDVYALGAILYECLTGRPPFRAASVMETVQQVIHDDPVLPGKLIPGLPRDLETICLKALRKDPEKRYPTATALAEDLGRYLSGESILARPASRVEKTIKLARRNPVITGIASALLVGAFAVLAVVAFAYMRLQKERNYANDQRDKAERRLDMAIDAVERMMTRVTGEKWTHIPELQDERREIMEEAISVYQQFLEEESDDPRLRRTSSQALYKIGTAHLTLGDLGKAAEAFDQALALSKGLMDDFPNEPDYRRDYALQLGMSGHVLILDADFEKARERYNQMVAIAEKLTLEFPAREDFRETLIEGLNFQGNSNLASPATALPYYKRTVDEANRLMAGPNPSYTTRLQWIVATLNVTLLDPQGPKDWSLDENYKKAMAMVGQLAKEKPPNSYKSDQFEVLTAQSYQVEAQMMVRKGKTKEALDHIGLARKKMEDILKFHSRNFPIRNQYLSILRTQVVLAEKAGFPELVKSVNQDILRETDSLVALYPKMTWITSTSLINRTMVLIEEMKQGKGGDWQQEIRDMIVKANESSNLRVKQFVTYNCACIHAQGSLLLKTEKEKNDQFQEAVSKLIQVRELGYFKDPTLVRELDKDKDLDPIRSFLGYIEFRKTLNPGPKTS